MKLYKMWNLWNKYFWVFENEKNYHLLWSWRKSESTNLNHLISFSPIGPSSSIGRGDVSTSDLGPHVIPLWPGVGPSSPLHCSHPSGTAVRKISILLWMILPALTAVDRPPLLEIPFFYLRFFHSPPSRNTWLPHGLISTISGVSPPAALPTWT